MTETTNPQRPGEGWRLVPAVLEYEMASAMIASLGSDDDRPTGLVVLDLWQAALAAAPLPPAPDEGMVEAARAAVRFLRDEAYTVAANNDQRREISRASARVYAALALYLPPAPLSTIALFPPAPEGVRGAARALLEMVDVMIKHAPHSIPSGHVLEPYADRLRAALAMAEQETSGRLEQPAATSGPAGIDAEGGAGAEDRPSTFTATKEVFDRADLAASPILAMLKDAAKRLDHDPPDIRGAALSLHGARLAVASAESASPDPVTAGLVEEARRFASPRNFLRDVTPAKELITRLADALEGK